MPEDVNAILGIKSDSGPALASAGNNPSAVDPGLAGIGGWLILPAIGLVVGPIVGVISLIAALAMISDVVRAGYGGVYAVELLVSAGLLAYSVYAATLFFGKRRAAPSTCIALMVTALVCDGGLLVIELGAGAAPFAIETGKHLVLGIISAAIWIPYFGSSKRVEATFVN